MEEKKSYSKVVICLFKKWDSDDVLYCHWKSSVHLEATFLTQTDIDVLVAKEDAKLAINKAEELGFVEVKSSHFRGYPGVRDFICYDEEFNRWVHLHFHTQLSAGDRWVKAYHLSFEKFILDNRVRHNEFELWIISPEFEMLMLIYRMNAKFKKNWLKDRLIQDEIFYLQENYKKYPKQLESVIGNFLDKKSVSLLKDLLEGEKNISQLSIQSYRKYFKEKEFRRMSYLRFFFLSKLRYSYRLYTEFNKRVLKKYSAGRRSLPNGGLVIAFIGIDGSGKTTGIKRVVNSYKDHVNIQCNFLGSGKSGAGLIRRTVMSLIGFKAKSQGHKQARKVEKAGIKETAVPLKKPPIYYTIWILLCTIDRERQLRYIQRGLGNGNLVFVDRWLQDSVLGGLDSSRLHNYVGYNGFLGRVARREATLYKKIKLVPLHQVIKLNITPELSVARKPGELTEESAKEAITNLNSIQWPSETMVIDIDATKDIDLVTQNIINSVWTLMQQNR